MLSTANPHDPTRHLKITGSYRIRPPERPCSYYKVHRCCWPTAPSLGRDSSIPVQRTRSSTYEQSPVFNVADTMVLTSTRFVRSAT
ncbi:hypothetical protein BDP81DRAFT_418377 [Colletotrichum phormii]|uniref:Uncharacterized protein n=1 Tax=Colletotrichum phormii TaxID=359342 RepID=A0AAJ0ELT9_9PEZI|nr:uncharacterized protein BDP81DRAFT_418377 [Colletotrichum phormii]KAK1641245.1 hypothetical protein BDP81DRAFT_418377 [Colletotrichum phormii]